MAIQNAVSIGPEIVPPSLSDTIMKKYADGGLAMDGVADDIQWRILSGKSRYPEHLPFLSRSAAIFRVRVYVVSTSYLFIVYFCFLLVNLIIFFIILFFNHQLLSNFMSFLNSQECFDPIVAKSGRDLIPVMVYG